MPLDLGGVEVGAGLLSVVRGAVAVVGFLLLFLFLLLLLAFGASSKSLNSSSELAVALLSSSSSSSHESQSLVDLLEDDVGLVDVVL
jgi:hypothetical protein